VLAAATGALLLSGYVAAGSFAVARRDVT